MNNEHPSGAPYHDCQEVSIHCDPSEIFPGLGLRVFPVHLTENLKSQIVGGCNVVAIIGKWLRVEIF